MKLLALYFTLLFAAIVRAESNANDCTEYKTKTVKYVHYSASSVYEAVVVTVTAAGGGTATTLVTEYASPVVVTVQGGAAVDTVTESVIITQGNSKSASVTVTQTATKTGLTAVTYVTNTQTVASTVSVLLETVNAATVINSWSVGQFAILALAGLAILAI